MAIVQSYEDKFGNTNANAYWRVVEVNCNWERKTAHMSVVIFKNKVARINGKQPLNTISYDFIENEFDTVYGSPNLDTSNPLKASYTYLKTLTEYVGATDDL